MSRGTPTPTALRQRRHRARLAAVHEIEFVRADWAMFLHPDRLPQKAGCPLDLHSRVFGPGTVTRTLLGKAEIILHRPEVGSGFRLYVARSFAPHLWTCRLAAAAREFGGLAEAAA
jgi:hypothetical protein